MDYCDRMPGHFPFNSFMLSPSLPIKHWNVWNYVVNFPTLLVILLTYCADYTAFLFEPPHDKTNNVVVRPAKTQISLGIRPVWSESSLTTWRKLGSLATHWPHSEDSDQTGRMPRLIWVFAGRTATLLVLSWSGSFAYLQAWPWWSYQKAIAQ